MHLYLLLLAQGDATQIIQRYEHFRTSHPVLMAEYQVSPLGKSASMKAKLLMERNSRLKVKCDGAGVNYVYLSTPRQALEIDYTTKQYDEAAGSTQFYFVGSKLTGALGWFPRWITPGDFRTKFPKDAKWAVSGSATLDGVACDKIRANLSGQVTGYIESAIDHEGRVHELTTDLSSMGRRYAFRWRFSKMEMLASAPVGSFDLTIPSGYVPYRLPAVDGPMAAGSKFPTSGWRSAGGGAFDLKGRLGRKGALIALLGQDSEPSDRARSSIGKLRPNIPVVVLTNGSSAAKGADAYDPSGKLLKQIAAPATPLFLLLDPNGKVTHLWMGYDPAKAAGFEKEVREAFGR